MRLSIALILAAGAAQAQAGLLRYNCTLADGGYMAVFPFAHPQFGTLICVEAPNTDPVPEISVVTCAPQGGWGLSTFDGRLNDVTTDARFARIVATPKFFAHLGPSELVASAMMGSGIPLTLELDDRTYWRLRLDLASGQGVVETQSEGEQAVECRPAGGP